MNLTNNYHPINSKNYESSKYNPYLLSNKENIDNNLSSIYNISNSNISSKKREITSNDIVKKSLNIDISESINNSNNTKKEIEHNIQRYSSFSSLNVKNNTLELKDKNKKTLILDLDETLVHSGFTPFSRKSDLMLTISFDGEDRLLYVLKRPYVDEFLSELSNLYEIIIFTASIPEYANPVLDLLDKHKCIKYRLFREHCVFDNGIYIKDLKIFDRKINNMIIIDNNPLSYDNNVENGIPILSWYEDTNDNELMKLIPVLKYMANNDIIDVRTIINKFVDRVRNGIDFIAINKIIENDEKNKKEQNDNSENKNQPLISNNEYRKMNKSEEPKIKLNNNNSINDKYSSLKSTYSNNNNNELMKNNLLNTRYNINNIYNSNFTEKPNINIDIKDPSGTRISIFSPEEYNTLYNYKSYHFPFNRNMYTINSIEERKNNTYSKILNTPVEKNNYLINNSNNNTNTIASKRQLERTLTPKINYKKNENHMNKIKNQNTIKVNRQYSLVELTKKALHLEDIKDVKEDKINDEYDSVSKALNRFNKNGYKIGENKIMHNNYIKGNSYINNYRNDKNTTKNPKVKYFRNYIEEAKKLEGQFTNDNSITKKQLNLLKQFSSFNKDSEKMPYNISFKERLLKRMSEEKVNNYLGNKDKLTEKNYNNNNYSNNYSLINKYSYINNLKNTLEKNKPNINKATNSIHNYNNVASYDYKRFDLLNDYKNKEYGKITSSHKSLSYINGKLNNMVNLKQMNLKKNEKYTNINNLMKSSSFIQSNNGLNKLMNNLSFYRNDIKENQSNNINLNYKYNLINDIKKKNLLEFNNTYY